MNLTRNHRAGVGILGAVVTILALYFITSQLNLELFVQAWRTAEYWVLLPTLILLLLGLVTRALRWQVLLDSRLPLSRAFSIMNVAYLVNGVLPLRIGEVARVFLVNRTQQRIPIPTTTSTIIIERLLDLLAVGLMALLALAMGPIPDQIRAASAVAAFIAVIGFGVMVLLARRRDWAQRVFNWVRRFLPLVRRWSVLEDWFGQFLDGLMPLTRLRSLVLAFGWTALSWALSTAAGYVLMYAFFDQASLAATMLYIAAAAFAIALPAVPGNVGTYEASILLALTAMGYEQGSTAIAFAVMVHAVNLIVHAATGIIGFIQEGISFQQLSQGVRQMQQQSTTTEAG